MLLDGDPCNIVENEFVKPGKGQAFSRVKLRNLKTGRMLERTFKSGESIEAADVVETDMQYLYSDGETYHFMTPDTFEQHEISAVLAGEATQWLRAEAVCTVTLYNGAPLSITPPNFVVLTVTETEPDFRGDTAQGGSKPATLETGACIRVPLFVKEGEQIKIDTRSGDYVSRHKD